MKYLREIDPRFQHLGVKVGGFLIVLALLLALMAGLLGWRQDYFVPTVTLYAHPDRAEGILPGTDVSLHGIRIGRVRSVRLDENGRPLLEFYIRRSALTWMRADAVARLSGVDFLTTPFVNLLPGSEADTTLEPGATLPFERELTMGEVTAALEIQLRPVIAGARALVEELNRPDGDVRLSLLNLREVTDDLARDLPVLLEDARASAGVSRRFLEEITAEDGDLLAATGHFRHLSGELDEQLPVLLTDAGASLAALKRATANLEQTVKSASPEVGTLVKSSREVSEKADALLTDVRKIWLLKLLLPRKQTLPPGEQAP